jgi:hypothetical protein
VEYRERRGRWIIDDVAEGARWRQRVEEAEVGRMKPAERLTKPAAAEGL